MTKGDIVLTPAGKLAKYLGGGQNGADFVYVDKTGKPLMYRGAPDGFCVSSLKLLASLQSRVVARV